MTIRFIDGPTVDAMLDYPSLIQALETLLRGEVTIIQRQLLRIPGRGAEDGFLGIMPSWLAGRIAGVKLVTGFPGNAARGMPGIAGLYVLIDANDGRMLAVLDGTRLTARRTAAMAALASDRLARANGRVLLVVGTGAVAHELPAAHRAIRAYDRVLIWGRDPARAQGLAALVPGGSAVTDLEAAARQADHISCATASGEALILGGWLTRGQHVDLIGAFTPAMRESDTALIARASVYADRVDEVEHTGDIAGPVAEGHFRLSDIRGDLTAIARATGPLRQGPDEITVFKSAGHAGADLAAALLAYERSM